MTYRECYQKGVELLRKASVPDAQVDARLLLEYVCHTDRNVLLVYGERDVSMEEQDYYDCLLTRRVSREPLQYITGEQSFMGLDFKVNEHVLIPRQDTEVLVEEALKVAGTGNHILDMCTGSGCILISMLSLGKNLTGVGVDISAAALQVASENGDRLLAGEHSSDCKKQIQFIESNLFENVEGEYDMILSNPPYIRSEVIATLMPEVKEHEPMGALDGTADGLYFYRRIVEESLAYLKKGGYLFFEIGYDQGEEVSSLMKKEGYEQIRVIKDLAGLDRIVTGCR